jgi:O-antigen ligase
MRSAPPAVVRYERVLAMLAVLVFYTNVTLWAFTARVSSLPPLVYVGAFAFAVTPLFFLAGRGWEVGRSPLVRWVAVYGIITCASFLWAPTTDVTFQILRARVDGMLFLLAAMRLLAEARAAESARAAMVIAVLAGVGLNVYEFFNLGVFSDTLGRSAGLYVNANVSGGSLLAGCIAGLPAVRPKARGYFVWVVALGILLTLSRGALLCLVAIVLALLLSRGIRIGRIFGALAILSGVALGALAMTGGLERVQSAYDVAEDQWTRLMPGAEELEVGDEYSTEYRRDVAERAWETFSEHPLMGAGTGSTGDTTHNMYLMVLAEHGILGLLIYPGVAIALCWRRAARRRVDVLLLAVFLGLWGLFSHNVLEEFPLLLCVAVVSADSGREGNEWVVPEGKLQRALADAPA